MRSGSPAAAGSPGPSGTDRSIATRHCLSPPGPGQRPPTWASAPEVTLSILSGHAPAAHPPSPPGSGGHVRAEPGDAPGQEVDGGGELPDAVSLLGVDDQLRVDAAGGQRLV